MELHNVDGLPFSQSCENNKAPILEFLREVFVDRAMVLEVASGTGQHACHFAGNMPWLQWQPTELADNLPVLVPRCTHYAGENLLAPVDLDVRDSPWPLEIPDALFGANLLHIMSFGAVEKFFTALGRYAPGDVMLAVYGPFNYGGHYTSPSNARFDQWLARQNPESAIRHFEDVDGLARDAGFTLSSDNEMPANNRLLVWNRSTSGA
jgi:hypothetical protein